MDARSQFVDYYDLLKVDPGCDARTLEMAYHYFAKLYHPDTPGTADVDRFSAIVEAYTALRDPQRRAEYDELYGPGAAEPAPARPATHDADLDERAALNDADFHHRILLQLYRRRRQNARDAGVVGWLLQEQLECSDQEFEFHLWYLRAKGLIDITEQGTLEVTLAGVDHIIAA